MSHHLLLVDDERDFLRACSAALSRRGLEVTSAECGEDALRLLEEQTFDAAVLDVKMPGIDGVELFHQISLRWPEMPVILLTGHGSLQLACQTSREGIFDYLSKPVAPEVLALVIHRAVRAGNQRREAAAQSPTQRSRGGEPTVEVLLVDDEPELHQAMVPVLTRRGITVTTATTGQAALEATVKQVFDVIVLDLKLPDLDGLEVLRRLKQRAPLTEVILLTGHPSVSAALQALRLGAREVFIKPHDPDSLARTIRKAFDAAQARAEDDLQRLVDEAISRSPS